MWYFQIRRSLASYSHPSAHAALYVRQAAEEKPLQPILTLLIELHEVNISAYKLAPRHFPASFFCHIGKCDTVLLSPALLENMTLERGHYMAEISDIDEYSPEIPSFVLPPCQQFGSRFMQLPFEIRGKILELLLVRPTPIRQRETRLQPYDKFEKITKSKIRNVVYTGPSNLLELLGLKEVQSFGFHLQVMRACQRLLQESQQIFYTKNRACLEILIDKPYVKVNYDGARLIGGHRESQRPFTLPRVLSKFRSLQLVLELYNTYSDEGHPDFARTLSALQPLFFGKNIKVCFEENAIWQRYSTNIPMFVNAFQLIRCRRLAFSGSAMAPWTTVCKSVSDKAESDDAVIDLPQMADDVLQVYPRTAWEDAEGIADEKKDRFKILCSDLQEKAWIFDVRAFTCLREAVCSMIMDMMGDSVEWACRNDTSIMATMRKQSQSHTEWV